MSDKETSVFKIIEDNFPNMSPHEVEVEFLTLAWIGLVQDKRIVIRKNMELFFIPADSNSIPPGENITAVQFFNEYLGPQLIDSVKVQDVYVINHGDNEFAFMNRHEMSMDDFFLRALPVAKATAFIKDLMLQKNLDNIDDVESE